MSHVEYDVSPEKEHLENDSCNVLADGNISVDISVEQNLPQNWTKLVGFTLSPARCNNEMGLGDEYSDRSQQLACLRQSIHTHKR